jgi:hypothetical protein
MLLICLICLVFGCSVAIFVLHPPSSHQPSYGHISVSIRPIDPIFSAFFISIYLFWFSLRWKLLWKCFICLVFDCSVAIFVFCVLHPINHQMAISQLLPGRFQPPNGHISASTRPIDPIFSAFFISFYLFWSSLRWELLWKSFICLVFDCSVAIFVFCTPSTTKWPYLSFYQAD